MTKMMMTMLGGGSTGGGGNDNDAINKQVRHKLQIINNDQYSILNKKTMGVRNALCYLDVNRRYISIQRINLEKSKLALKFIVYKHIYHIITMLTLLFETHGHV